ncbi:MAG: NTP transferase domain-containing protein [Candidatus Heimdallarchaeota archaeon]|nr:NTP transferase domain-containing protein [Candidatus Heimdallarchaeota archaeon]
MSFDLKKIPVIVLAAGESKRMGVPKGLLDYRGKPFFSYQIEILKKIGFTEIIAVLGNYADLYREKIMELMGTHISVNLNPEKGPFSSIQCGLTTIEQTNSQGVFILPLDVPCPKEEVWTKLATSLFSLNVNVTIPEFEGKRGHPVLISEKFKSILRSCSSDSRLDFEINKQKDLQKAKIISVNDKRITLNINTLEDWEAFKVME